METAKSHARRFVEGWYDRYAPADKPGIDIGCGADPLHSTFGKWDYQLGNGDATLMTGVKNETYTTVYASHVLEHLTQPRIALQNWWRILAKGGHLIVVVPHRDLYECRKKLPSQWNPDHKWFYLPHRAENPHTLGLFQTVYQTLANGEIVSFRVLDEGYRRIGNEHPQGEYSIECIVRKPA